MALKYKVGDRLSVINAALCTNYSDMLGQSIIVTAVIGSNSPYYEYDILDENGLRIKQCWNCLQDDNLERFDSTRINNINNEGDNMSVAQEIQDLDLSADDAMLLKHNLIHRDGTLTPDGLESIYALSLKAYKPDLVAALKKIDAAKKAAK